jgi:ubiquitin-conjugating enzyme E2 D/E
MSGTMKRINLELKKLEENPIEGISVVQKDKNDIFNCRGMIIGPKGTPYEDGIFYLDIEYPKDYPFQPMKFSFITRIFHPNITMSGKICDLDFKHPGLTVSRALLIISALIAEPIPDDPLVPEIAYLYKTDRAKFEKIAKNWTRRYANKIYEI